MTKDWNLVAELDLMMDDLLVDKMGWKWVARLGLVTDGMSVDWLDLMKVAMLGCDLALRWAD